MPVNSPLTTEDMMLASMHRMEESLEQIEELTAAIAWQTMPHWRRWLARWRNARAVIDQTEQENSEPPALLPMKFD